MSTRYYWLKEYQEGGDTDHPDTLIGTSSYGGKDAGLQFCWESEPHDVWSKLYRHQDEDVVIDEYEKTFTGEQMMDHLSKVRVNDITVIARNRKMFEWPETSVLRDSM